ncbi:hypothetical protein ElyMa_005268800 [Elysia marginata]|uniref:Uncharacterized protein n=1 Tax=Elysia marginata TaxID=1093978 RepID=A0AAV4JZJ1_9GAST|nr:hypothetical protein ElyMa_005268800 [Elysia marginata]
MDGIRNFVFKDGYIIELFLSFQLLKNQHSFMQVYFMDSGEAVQQRKSLFQGLEFSSLANVQDLLHQHNRCISELRYAYEFARNHYGSYVIVISENARHFGEHERRYNAPTSNDIAILMSNDPEGHREAMSVDASVNYTKLMTIFIIPYNFRLTQMAGAFSFKQT